MCRNAVEYITESFGAELKSGAIVLSEFPFEDAKDSDIFDNDATLEAGHVAMWTGVHWMPFCHSFKLGYNLPGLR